MIEAENRTYPNKVAVLIPEAGVQLRSVGSLLRAIANVTPREVRFLGTGQWNDQDIWREPSLYGGAFPAPNPTELQDFEKRYQAIYGEAAPRLASFGYDAGALAATLVQKRVSASRAPSRPPVISPCARQSAFIAPALVPLTPSNSNWPSSSSASSTPQVKAPWAPPPCRARLIRLESALRESICGQPHKMPKNEISGRA